MSCIKTIFTKMFILFVFPGWICSTHCFSETDAFFKEEELHGVRFLRRDIKIPVGVADNTLNHAQLPKGTPLNEISSKISQRREEIGLPPVISLEQQNDFFHDFSWQMAKKSIVKSPFPARVTKIYVHEGQQIEKGELLCKIECMKMECALRSPFSGETTDIFLKEQDNVQYDSPLIGLFPTSPEWEEVDREHIFDNKDLLVLCFPWAMSPPVEPHAPDDFPPDGGEENESWSVLSADSEPKPVEPSEKEPPSPLPALPGEENLVTTLISEAPKEIVLRECEPFSPLSVLQIILPPEEVVVPLQVSSEDSLQEKEILVKPLLQPIQVLHETPAPIPLPHIEEKALEAQDFAVFPVKGIVAPLHMKSEDDIHGEEILMKFFPQPMQVVDETLAPIPQSFAEKIAPEEQNSIALLELQQETSAVEKELDNERKEESTPEEEIGSLNAFKSLAFPVSHSTQVIAFLPQLHRFFNFDLLMGREDTLFCVPLVSSPRKLGSNETICNKTALLWIPAYAGMTPVSRKQGIFTFNEHTPQKTFVSYAEVSLRTQGEKKSFFDHSHKLLKTQPAHCESDFSIFSGAMGIGMLLVLCSLFFILNYYRLRRSRLKKLYHKTYFKPNVLIGREYTLFYFSLMSSPRRRGSNGTIRNKTTILWIPAYAGMTPAGRKHGIFKFSRYIRYLHAVNINQQRFIIHQAAYDMNLYVDLKRKPLNKNDDQRKGAVNWWT
ncbi:MAG: biotin/lipoyl-binding protein [Alphaproteobacteria bacterium]|nr:biotin/lipoyl-binding protein [Alphaproteobacteria bacterium]